MASEQPEIKVPLERWVREIAREAATTALAEHQKQCKISAVEERVAKVEIRQATLVGFMAGSGVLGGLAGALVSGLF